MAAAGRGRGRRRRRLRRSRRRRAGVRAGVPGAAPGVARRRRRRVRRGGPAGGGGERRPACSGCIPRCRTRRCTRSASAGWSPDDGPARLPFAFSGRVAVGGGRGRAAGAAEHCRGRRGDTDAGRRSGRSGRADRVAVAAAVRRRPDPRDRGPARLAVPGGLDGAPGRHPGGNAGGVRRVAHVVGELCLRCACRGPGVAGRREHRRHAVGGGDPGRGRPAARVPDPDAAAVWGLVRSAQAEQPGRFVLLDWPTPTWTMPTSTATACVDDGLVAAALASGEPQLAARGGRLWAPRLARVPRGAQPPMPPRGTTDRCPVPVRRRDGAGDRRLRRAGRPGRRAPGRRPRGAAAAAGVAPRRSGPGRRGAGRPAGRGGRAGAVRRLRRGRPRRDGRGDRLGRRPVGGRARRRRARRRRRHLPDAPAAGRGLAAQGRPARRCWTS